MAAPKRTRAQRECDLVEVARQHLAGRTQQQIAETLGVSRQQVGYDLQALLKRWRGQALKDVDEHVSLQLAKLNAVEAEWWRQWEQSTEGGRLGRVD